MDASNNPNNPRVSSPIQTWEPSTQIKSLVEKGPTGETGCFQVLNIVDENGKEIPILDQLHPKAPKGD